MSGADLVPLAMYVIDALTGRLLADPNGVDAPAGAPGGSAP
jgi:hypothetical protein